MEVDAELVIAALREQLSEANWKIALLTAQINSINHDITALADGASETSMQSEAEPHND